MSCVALTTLWEEVLTETEKLARVDRLVKSLSLQVPFELRHTPDAGVGAFVQADVSSFEFTVPSELCVSAGRLDGSLRAVLSDEVGSIDRLVLFLLWEVSRGEASPWELYLDSLPRIHDLTSFPIFFPIEDFDASGSLGAAVRQNNASVGRTLAWLNTLAPHLPELMEEALTWRAVAWATAIVVSRRVGAQHLVPVLDLLNHAPGGSVCSVNDDDSVSVAFPALAAGDEVALTYFDTGDVAAAVAFVRYGFVAEETLKNGVVVHNVPATVEGCSSLAVGPVPDDDTFSQIARCLFHAVDKALRPRGGSNIHVIAAYGRLVDHSLSLLGTNDADQAAMDALALLDAEEAARNPTRRKRSLLVLRMAERRALRNHRKMVEMALKDVPKKTRKRRAKKRGTSPG